MSKQITVTLLLIAVAVLGFFFVAPAYRAAQLRSTLAKGFQHVRALENAARARADKTGADGLGVITTTWTNVFQNYSVIDRNKLEVLMQAILEQEIQGPSPSYEVLDSWLESIKEIDPRSKTYIETLARPNLTLNFKPTTTGSAD